MLTTGARATPGPSRSSSPTSPSNSDMSTPVAENWCYTQVCCYSILEPNCRHIGGVITDNVLDTSCLNCFHKV